MQLLYGLGRSFALKSCKLYTNKNPRSRVSMDIDHSEGKFYLHVVKEYVRPEDIDECLLNGKDQLSSLCIK